MSVPEQRQDQAADVSAARASDQETTPRIMVGTWSGEVAVVEARTGRECWIRRTGRRLGTHVILGEAVYFSTGESFKLMKRLQTARDLDPVRRQRLIDQENSSTQLQARRARDGALLWTYAHPDITGLLHVEAEDGVVVAGNSRHFSADTPPIQAFDGMSGRLLWQVEGADAQWSSDQLVTVRGGRVFTWLSGRRDTIAALDIHTGSPLWQRSASDHWVFSPNGDLIGEHRTSYDENGHLQRMSLTLIDARDGSELASVPTAGVIRQLSDDGIAYVDRDIYDEAAWVAAVDIRTGEELWRAQEVEHGYLALDGRMLCYSRLVRGATAEVGALDAATGESLWRWRSPASLNELLRLWGARRMPLMLWDSTEKSAATLASIVGRPWFRLRRPPSGFRGPQRRLTPATRLRGIGRGIAQNVWWPLWHEMTEGHWRHPWQLHGAMNANWLVARWGIVFLGTWLGLFALDARDGRLLWHALPTLDLSHVAPALAP